MLFLNLVPGSRHQSRKVGASLSSSLPPLESRNLRDRLAPKQLHTSKDLMEGEAVLSASESCHEEGMKTPGSRPARQFHLRDSARRGALPT